MARATVATDVQRCRLVVKNSVTGLLFNVPDAADFARTMWEMIDMGEPGCDRVVMARRSLMENSFDVNFITSAYRKFLSAAGVRA